MECDKYTEQRLIQYVLDMISKVINDHEDACYNDGEGAHVDVAWCSCAIGCVYRALKKVHDAVRLE